MSDPQEKPVVLDEENTEKTISLKNALNYKSENAVISESLDITRQVVRVIRAGGTVVLTDKNGNSNQYVMKL